MTPGPWSIEETLTGLPLLGPWYRHRAARIKRRSCLLLHRLGLLRPLSFVEWLATATCNCSCPYCGAPAWDGAGDELDAREVRRVLSEVRGLGARRLLVSGGEPLMRPDLPELLRAANEEGLDIGLVSNGWAVEERWEDMRKIRYFLYLTSLDGDPEDHDRDRGRAGSFNRALGSLDLFASIGVPVRIVNTVVHRENIGRLEDLVPFIRSSPATLWQLTPVTRTGRAALTDRFELTGNDLWALARFIGRHRGEMDMELGESRSYLGCGPGFPSGTPFFCGAGLTRCTIMPDGEVAGCQPLHEAGLSEGNVRRTHLSDIWRRGFARWRSETLPEVCLPCPHQAACDGGCRAQMHVSKQCLKEALRERTQQRVPGDSA
jgi:radical SAM protein with 4Fe4S-binding SPASM domain